MGKKKSQCDLFIPDLHIPFHHRHAFKFLEAVKKKYKPKRIFCTGDEIDGHAISMHDHSPDLHSPARELEMCISALKVLYRIFPVVDLVDSNHGSLYYRRASKNGLPRSVIKSYNEILEAPKTWRWHHDLTIKSSDGTDIYLCHGQSADAMKNSKNESKNYIQGHHHSKFEIRYWANKSQLYWGVTSGCLIDYKSLAFEYGRTMLNKPILGCTIVRDGHPILIPMVLKKDGSWTGELA